MKTTDSIARAALAAAFALLAALAPHPARAQEPPSCLSADSRQFPPTSKPYVLIIADTSGSMTNTVGTPAIASSCGYGADRRAHQRCAIRNTIQAFSGVANFGLMTFARKQVTCSSICYTGCTYADYPNNATGLGCGPGTGATRRGGFIQQPMLQDSFWSAPPPADNTSAIGSWVDNICANNTELFADGFAPLGGALRDAKRYFSDTGWLAQDNSVAYPTPLAAQDVLGPGINGGTGCRAVRVILIADGGENCDLQSEAAAASSDLFANGVVVGGKTFKIPVTVISFAGGVTTVLDQLASAGGTGTAVQAPTEVELTRAMAAVIEAAASPERCDNLDNNCNACTDEGFSHFANLNPTCCNWSTPAQRTTCLNNFQASISPANPLGTRTSLPCVTAQQSQQPANWGCYDPGETCDGIDNNGDGQTDEGQLKCGNPLHCATNETCNGQDDDCDGLVDENNVCPGGGTGSAEVCNGCDDDFDGLADNGVVGSVTCGRPTPANCPGTQLCKPPVPVPPGGCAAGAGYAPCNNNPQAESCDTFDNDCDGIVDDNLPATSCMAPGTPSGLVFGGTSQCTMGSQGCGGACVGFVGPSGEVTDGIDNDCDGIVDNIFLFRNGFE